MRTRLVNPDSMNIPARRVCWPFNRPVFLCCLSVALAFGLPLSVVADPVVRSWTSSENMKYQLAPGKPLHFVSGKPPLRRAITIDDSKTYQTIIGIGSSLEPTTCFNLSLLPPGERERVIDSLVNPKSGIGMNVMRICIGTPDFTGDPWYSYNDVPPGETDPDLERFSIEKDRRYILPVLKLALKRNPNLLFCATPWSPPGWMTSTGDMIGGHLLPKHYPAYARYFVRFIKAYEAEGIPIHAVTIQNEPGVDRSVESNSKWHYPSCRWTGAQERDFIKNHLGPVFESHGIKTEIWTYDHNFNVGRTREGDDPGIDYPRTVLSDPEAARYVDGVAFHGYAGKPEGMTIFHREFPRVPLYFTEGSTFGAKGAVQIIGYFRNWASCYKAWVTMIDERHGPNNGPFKPDRTCITLDTSDSSVAYHFDYFMYGQFMKFVQRGARRIESSGELKDLPNVAFKNPDGSIVLIVANPSRWKKQFEVSWRASVFQTTLARRSVATFKWAEGDLAVCQSQHLETRVELER